jgi:glycosyltransferase involved in cell wall biosynthesis
VTARAVIVWAVAITERPVAGVVPPPVIQGAGEDPGRGLRVALLGYRGDPRCGGQGVYLRHLGRELALLGHDVTVVAGPPYPELDPVTGPGALRLVEVPSLGWNPPPPGAAEAPPARLPRDRADLLEAHRCLNGGFGEPAAFAMRARRLLRRGLVRAQVVHDNQSLGPSLLGVQADGWPVLATIHHPLTVDRDLARSRSAGRAQRRGVDRWWRFVDHQARVAAALPRSLTVSQASADDVVRTMGVPAGRLAVVPVGTDPTVFSPRPAVGRVTGRLVTTSSADVPLKGLVHLVEALALVRREHPSAHLVVVSRVGPAGPVADAIARHRLEGAVRFVSGLSDDELVAEHAAAEVAVVPSLYEGFSLPAVEAMACAVPLVATTGGALPEVVGADGEAGLLVPPADPGALAAAVGTLLADADLRARMGAAGRRRVVARFTWRRCAQDTAEHYRDLLERRAVVRQGAAGRTPLAAPVGSHR